MKEALRSLKKRLKKKTERIKELRKPWNIDTTPIVCTSLILLNAFSSRTRLFGYILFVISSIFSILIMLYVFELIDLELDWYF